MPHYANLSINSSQRNSNIRFCGTKKQVTITFFTKLWVWVLQFQKANSNILLNPHECDKAFRKLYDTENQWEKCKVGEVCVL